MLKDYPRAGTECGALRGAESRPGEECFPIAYPTRDCWVGVTSKIEGLEAEGCAAWDARIVLREWSHVPSMSASFDFNSSQRSKPLPQHNSKHISKSSSLLPQGWSTPPHFLALLQFQILPPKIQEAQSCHADRHNRCPEIDSKSSYITWRVVVEICCPDWETLKSAC